MDNFDRERYSSVYRTLAEILDRDRPDDRIENHLSYVLGDLARRMFAGSQFVPPDELLEEAATVLRTGKNEELHAMARRLRDHAQHLDDVGRQDE
ncbi:MAG: hypothetical protein RIC55_16150 [Pirellulaceae bacterium]